MSSLGAQSRLEWPHVKTEENGGRWCASCDRDERKVEHCCEVLMSSYTQKDVKHLDLYVEIKMN